jgi:hypothetical protein
MCGVRLGMLKVSQTLLLVRYNINRLANDSLQGDYN